MNFINQSIFASINKQSTESTHKKLNQSTKLKQTLNQENLNEPTLHQPINNPINIRTNKQAINQIYKHSTNQSTTNHPINPVGMACEYHQRHDSPHDLIALSCHFSGALHLSCKQTTQLTHYDYREEERLNKGREIKNDEKKKKILGKSEDKKEEIVRKNKIDGKE